MTTLAPGIVLRPISEASRLKELVRVLHIHASSDRVVLIAIEPQRRKDRIYFNACREACLPEILSELDGEHPTLVVTSVLPRPDARATDAELDNKYRKKGEDQSSALKDREKRWDLIKPLVNGPDSILLFDSQLRTPMIRAAAKALQPDGTEKSLRTLEEEIKRCLYQYWAGGSVKGALTTFRGACGGRGKERKQTKKQGRQNAETRAGIPNAEGFVPSDHDKDVMRYSWRNYYHRGTTIPKACRKMWREFYSIAETTDSGAIRLRLLPDEQRPTESQFKYWGENQSPGQAAYLKQLSQTNLARINRTLFGRANDDIVAIGQRGHIDSSPPDMQFVSITSRLKRIGPAHRILLVDSAFNYIAGFYLGLDAPSAETVNLAFLRAMTPMDELLKHLRLYDISPADFIQIVFSSVVGDNTDARAEKVFISLDAIGSGQFYIPVARSDMNAPVEVAHHQLHRMLDHNMSGTTHGKPRTERGEERADDLARHTILDALRELVRAIHAHNTMPLDINPTLEMQREILDKGLVLNRLNLTRMRIHQGRVTRSLLSTEECRSYLMPITRGVFTAHGVYLLRPDTGDKRTFVKSVRYVANHPLIVNKCKQAKTQRGKRSNDYYDDDFRHDPFNPRVIYYRDAHSGELISLEARTDDLELLDEASYHDILVREDENAVGRMERRAGRDQALCDMEAGQEQTKQTAEDEYAQELAAQPKPPSKSKLRADKTANREAEKELYSHGMPTDFMRDEVPPPKDETSAPIEVPTTKPPQTASKESGPDDRHPPPTKPAARPSIFAAAIGRNLAKNKETTYV